MCGRTMTAMVDEPWEAVARILSARIAELGLTKAEVIRRSGISFGTLSDYLAGAPIVRMDKRRGICEALRWTSDSIDRILRGEDPERLEPASPSSIDQMLDRLERLVERFEGAADRLERPS